MKTLVLLGTLFLLGFSYAEVVSFNECPPDLAEDGTELVRNCQMHELRIDPCPEAAQSKPCVVKRGRSAAIEFDFTSDVTMDNATSRAYWANELTDLPLVGMDTNSCEYTTCPIQAGTRQSFRQSLPLSKKFPVRTYDVKWRLGNDGEGVRCCLVFKIKLVK